MNIFQKAKAALSKFVTKSAAPRVVPSAPTVKEPPKEPKRKLKYFWVSTQPYAVKGVLRYLAATFSVGRNKEKRAVGRGWFRLGASHGRHMPKRNTAARRAMLDARRARQVAA